ncbi:hypothetical protein EBR43_08535 [bacterium]|nr:hypothetical protein [bacterium]NBW57815.1 hypothetical protein [bacterium]NBX71841.1 hypothetical protein [bacterium]
MLIIPKLFGEALTDDKIGLWRYRVGNNRMDCNFRIIIALSWCYAWVIAKKFIIERKGKLTQFELIKKTWG